MHDQCKHLKPVDFLQIEVLQAGEEGESNAIATSKGSGFPECSPEYGF